MALRLPGRMLGRGFSAWCRPGALTPMSSSVRAYATASSSSLDRFLSSIEDYQPERSASNRDVRKAHVDVPAQYLRFNAPSGKASAKSRKQLEELCEALEQQINDIATGDRAAVSELVQEIMKVGEEHGHNQAFWKLWVSFVERFPTTRVNLTPYGIASTEGPALIEEIRHQERSAFVTEVIERFSHVRGSSAPPTMPSVKNVDKRIFYTLPIFDPHHGHNMEEDMSLMLLKYENAAKYRDPIAQTRLANYYYTSYPEISRWWYRQADELHYGPAQYHRALNYEFGVVVEKQDMNEAIRLYKEAASRGSTPALNNLGALLRHSFPETAFEFFLEASKRGDADALCNLAICFLHGQGVTQDPSNAIRLLGCAAEYNHATALYHLGCCSALGIGMPVQEAVGVKYWGLAASLGDHESAYNLGMCFLKGHHLPQDESAAIKWFTKAAEIKHPFALYYLGQLNKSDNDVAQQFFQQSAEQAKFLKGDMKSQLKAMLKEQNLSIS